MIINVLENDVIHLSIAKKDFSYRIPVKKLDDVIDWRIGGKETNGIVIKNVSAWALQLFTKKVTDDLHINEFKQIVEEYCPDQTINWEETLWAIKIQNEFNGRIALNKVNKGSVTEDEIISILRKKYNVG